MNLQKLAPNLVATLFCWLSIGLVVLVTSPGAFIRDVVIVTACLATAAMWANWAMTYSTSPDAAPAEKAKRSASTDTNAALLLELLNEDERREVKERLLERLQTDGETSSLTDLLGDQTPKARRETR